MSCDTLNVSVHQLNIVSSGTIPESKLISEWQNKCFGIINSLQCKHTKHTANGSCAVTDQAGYSVMWYIYCKRRTI